MVDATDKISYSFYLWHLPIIFFINIYLDNKIILILLSLFLSFLLSLFTYNFIEKPFINFKKRKVYKSDHYLSSLNKNKRRDIHLGIDIFVNKNTALKAPLNGKIVILHNNNFKYDCVIRLRFDFQIQSPLLLDMDLNKMSIKDEKSHDEYSVNDHIAISNSDNMNIYSNVYNDFGDIYNKEKCH